MRTRHGLLAILLVLGAALTSVNASTPDILSFEHENLRNGQVEALEQLRGKTSFLLFFQPDCKWCLKQSRVLDRLLKTCPGRLNAAALGVHGSRHALKKELRRLRPGFPAYKTGVTMISELQGVPATPVMLLADERGTFTQSFRGYLPADELSRILAERHGIDCS